jgi:hypothetical protein
VRDDVQAVFGPQRQRRFQLDWMVVLYVECKPLTHDHRHQHHLVPPSAYPRTG